MYSNRTAFGILGTIRPATGLFTLLATGRLDCQMTANFIALQPAFRCPRGRGVASTDYAIIFKDCSLASFRVARMSIVQRRATVGKRSASRGSDARANATVLRRGRVRACVNDTRIYVRRTIAVLTYK